MIQYKKIRKVRIRVETAKPGEFGIYFKGSTYRITRLNILRRFATREIQIELHILDLITD